MSKRSIAVGSLVGAASIHLVMLACSGGGPASPPPSRDGGLAEAGPDALTDAQPDGILEAMVDDLQDVARDVASAETGVADAQAMDAGGGGCACPPPATTYSFNLTANGHPALNPSSHAEVEVRQMPPFDAPPGTPEPTYAVIGRATTWLPFNDTATQFSAYETLSCTIQVDGTHHLIGTNAYCYFVPVDPGPPPMQLVQATGAATLVSFTDTQVEFRIASLPSVSTSTSTTPNLTNVVFRASNPAGHFTTPGGDVVP